MSVDTTNQTRSKGARPRNRREARQLPDARLREIKRDFDVVRSTMDVGQRHLLPRAEATDACLIRVSDELVSVRQEINDLRRQMGIATTGPRVVRSAAA